MTSNLSCAGILGTETSPAAAALRSEFTRRGVAALTPAEALPAWPVTVPEETRRTRIAREGAVKAAYLDEALKMIAGGAEVLVLTERNAAPWLAELQAELTVPVVEAGDDAAHTADRMAEALRAGVTRPFRIGLVGGLGPAATVDLYKKIVDATPAKNDQEHIRVLVDQNPQVPDRTEYLLNGGADPTLPLFSACRRLEAMGADLLLIPCNTAHAFLEGFGAKLRVPVLNMQRVTMESIREKFGERAVIGLLATTGTCRTGIYADKAGETGLTLVTPEPAHQAEVMEAIYGKKGVKAGFTTGECRDSLLAAARHLVRDKGATVLILGCTELPLILTENECQDLGDGLTAAVVDPTATLARRAVQTAIESGRTPLSRAN
ncbi:amino acid racemase [Sutterella sp.]|uniref:amino acid racemase n=1 Tax=Sutterella sp. TaxID=1981025 RepID=UPI0026E08AFF|nr:amino acid racemase [Sutterella sp.]MDO5530876.1 amino acid racemase [Sutterella sp.]